MYPICANPTYPHHAFSVQCTVSGALWHLLLPPSGGSLDTEKGRLTVDQCVNIPVSRRPSSICQAKALVCFAFALPRLESSVAARSAGDLPRRAPPRRDVPCLALLARPPI